MTTQIDARSIVPGNNDRTKFDKKALRELADSIAANGLIQPITVRLVEDTDVYQIIAGERRYRATQLLNWQEVPCNVVDKNEEEASLAMLIENVQRNDLDPIDEGRAYASRIKYYGWDVDTLSKKTGLSKIRIQFRLKLISLRPDIQELISSGDLQLGYAQIISDANLDHNFQLVALRHLRDNASPTPAWFRRICSKLLEQQSQAIMFDTPLFGGPVLEPLHQEVPQEPPTPSTIMPPRKGGTTQDIISNQIKFWQEAASAWNELGKAFKRQECEAAVFALKSTLAVL